MSPVENYIRRAAVEQQRSTHIRRDRRRCAKCQLTSNDQCARAERDCKPPLTMPPNTGDQVVDYRQEGEHGEEKSPSAAARIRPSMADHGVNRSESEMAQKS